jgi:hypothetical protein
MADQNVIPCAETCEPKCLVYRQYDWGDFIYGSKAQLQALGIGLGVPYPGEPGGAKRKMTTTDQRGFPVEVRAEWEGGFWASVRFPGWPPSPINRSPKTLAFPGVHKQECPWRDEYTGKSADLIAAGLVKDEHLPGRPGMRKVTVSIDAAGIVIGSPMHANAQMGWKTEGAKCIHRVGDRYSVMVYISEAEHARRDAKRQVEEFEWRQLVRSLPRPARLDHLNAQVEVEAPRQRGHLRLVWSAASAEGQHA